MNKTDKGGFCYRPGTYVPTPTLPRLVEDYRTRSVELTVDLSGIQTGPTPGTAVYSTPTVQVPSERKKIFYLRDHGSYILRTLLVPR